MKFIDTFRKNYSVPNTFITFDDISLVPRYSEIESRLSDKIDTSCKIAGIGLKIPIISANMDCVTELQMAKAMDDAGGLGIFHRFYDDDSKYIADLIQYQSVTSKTPVISCGVSVNEYKKLEKVERAGVLQTICIDVAHAHTNLIREFIRDIPPSVDIIAGNVSTVDGAKFLMDLGIKTIKVGQTNGSVCQSRMATGFGVPQAYAIWSIRHYLGDKITIIADGGIRSAKDVVKSIALGANAVMLGKLLAGSDESSAKTVSHTRSRGSWHEEIKIYKKIYRGQSSKEFQMDKNIYREGIASEGVQIELATTGPVKNTLDELTGGLRSAMSYCGATTLNRLYVNSVAMEITNHGYIEGTPHGKK